jgi:hypothetical protein
MRRLQMSLRTTVILSLTFLMAAAMLLIGVVMFKVNQRDLLRAKVEQGRLLRAALEHVLKSELHASGGSLESLQGCALLDGLRTGSPEVMEYWQMTVTDRNARVVYASDGAAARLRQQLPDLVRVIRLGVEDVSFNPSRKTLSWRLPEQMVLDSPLFQRAQVVGAVRLETSLEEVDESLWHSQKLILFYIALDMLVLVIFGTYVFSKLVVGPVRQLVRTAEGYREGDRLPELTGGEENELAKLSQALNGMLQRLAEHKEELRRYITSLEQTNVELQRAQREVIMGEKMACVGRLAAGLAHEIGNPIGIVLGYLDLLRREDIGGDQRLELMGRMGSEIQRIHQILRQLLDFARPGTGERGPARIHPLIQESLVVLDYQLRKQGIEVSLDLTAELDTVYANADQLKQVFVNLMVNSMDAIMGADGPGRGGTLQVSTRSFQEQGPGANAGGQPLRRRTDPPAADYRHLRRSMATCERHWIQIQFADTGGGVAEENLERVCDPFFTTKEPGKGTGLGLSVSLQIVESIGGRMEVSSRVGVGTTVTLLLPVYDERDEREDDEGTARHRDGEEDPDGRGEAERRGL